MFSVFADENHPYLPAQFPHHTSRSTRHPSDSSPPHQLHNGPHHQESYSSFLNSRGGFHIFLKLFLLCFSVIHKGPHHRERYSSFAVSLFNFVFFNFALKLGNIQDSRIRNAVYKALRFLLRTSLTTVPLCKMPFIDRSRNGAEAS